MWRRQDQKILATNPSFLFHQPWKVPEPGDPLILWQLGDWKLGNQGERGFSKTGTKSSFVFLKQAALPAAHSKTASLASFKILWLFWGKTLQNKHLKQPKAESKGEIWFFISSVCLEMDEQGMFSGLFQNFYLGRSQGCWLDTCWDCRLGQRWDSLLGNLKWDKNRS